MPRSTGRGGRPWQRVRAQVLATEDHCWWCGRPVDKTLSGRHPWGPTADHIVPLSRGGNPLDRANLRLSHLRCNASRRDGLPRTKRRTSERW